MEFKLKIHLEPADEYGLSLFQLKQAIVCAMDDVAFLVQFPPTADVKHHSHTDFGDTYKWSLTLGN